MISNRPLVQIAASYVVESYPNIPQDDLAEVTRAIEDLIDSKVSYKECYNIVYSKIGIATSVDKIQQILSVDINFTPQDVSQVYDKPEHGRRRARPWTAEEDIRLLAGINKYGLESWEKVLSVVGNGRTKPQCSQRWYRGINPKINKSPWSEAENQKLFKLVDEYGVKVWSKVAAQMGSRSDVQCRYHYFQLIKNSRSKHTRNHYRNSRVHHAAKALVDLSNKSISMKPRVATQQKQESTDIFNADDPTMKLNENHDSNAIAIEGEKVNSVLTDIFSFNGISQELSLLDDEFIF